MPIPDGETRALRIRVLWLTGILFVALTLVRFGDRLPINISYVELVSTIAALPNEDSIFTPIIDGPKVAFSRTYMINDLVNRPIDASLLYGVGVASLLVGNNDTARTALASAEAARNDLILPLRLLAQQRLGKLNEIPTLERMQYAEQLSNLAYSWVNGGKRPEGLALYELATALAPEQLDIWLARIDAYANDWQAMQASWNQAKALFPGEPYLEAVEAFYQLYGVGNRDAAQAAADSALAKLSLDSAKGSPVKSKWLYNLYLVKGDLVISSPSLAVGWYLEAAELPVSSYFRHLAESLAERLVSNMGVGELGGN